MLHGTQKPPDQDLLQLIPNTFIFISFLLMDVHMYMYYFMQQA